MVMKDDVSELFHTKPYEVEDPTLDHLIEDIHGDKFVKGYWDVKRNEKKKKTVKDKAASVTPPESLYGRTSQGQPRNATLIAHIDNPTYVPNIFRPLAGLPT